jgi:hypothetical protein
MHLQPKFVLEHGAGGEELVMAQVAHVELGPPQQLDLLVVVRDHRDTTADLRFFEVGHGILACAASAGASPAGATATTVGRPRCPGGESPAWWPERHPSPATRPWASADGAGHVVPCTAMATLRRCAQQRNEGHDLFSNRSLGKKRSRQDVRARVGPGIQPPANDSHHISRWRDALTPRGSVTRSRTWPSHVLWWPDGR